MKRVGKNKKKRKILSQIKELDNPKLKVFLLEESEEKDEPLYGLKKEEVVDSIYLGISQGVRRGKIRFDIYESWINEDLTIETISEMISLIWRIDKIEDDEGSEKWFKENEKYIRDYATEMWVALRYQET